MPLSKPRASKTVLIRQISECIYGNKSLLGKFRSNSRIRCTIYEYPDYWHMCPPGDFSHIQYSGKSALFVRTANLNHFPAVLISCHYSGTCVYLYIEA
jgi:hypothetical protein